MGAEVGAGGRNALHILGRGMLSGFIRYIKHSADKPFNRVKLLARLISSCLCPPGGFAIGELAGLPFSAYSPGLGIRLTAVCGVLLVSGWRGKCFEGEERPL